MPKWKFFVQKVLKHELDISWVTENVLRLVYLTRDRNKNNKQWMQLVNPSGRKQSTFLFHHQCETDWLLKFHNFRLSNDNVKQLKKTGCSLCSLWNAPGEPVSLWANPVLVSGRKSPAFSQKPKVNKRTEVLEHQLFLFSATYKSFHKSCPGCIFSLTLSNLLFPVIYPTDISQGTWHCFERIKIHWRLYLLQHNRTMQGGDVGVHLSEFDEAATHPFWSEPVACHEPN